MEKKRAKKNWTMSTEGNGRSEGRKEGTKETWVKMRSRETVSIVHAAHETPNFHMCSVSILWDTFGRYTPQGGLEGWEGGTEKTGETDPIDPYKSDRIPLNDKKSNLNWGKSRK